MFIYLGCYTDAAHTNGLQVVRLDEETLQMSVEREYPVSNALYQTLSPDAKILYSCTGEGLAAFAVGEEAELTKTCALELGDCVCHVAAMPDSRHVVFADYLGGFAGSVETAGGGMGKAVVHRHEGSGPNLPRQSSAHCHQALPLPDGAGYAVCDLGMDRIFEYPSARAFETTPRGAGPRHLVFHPNGKLAFLVSELGNLATSLSWDRASGFKTLHSLPTVEDAARQSIAAAIRFTPDFSRIVVSNRGENSLAVFDFDAETGRLEFKARTMLAGDWPRDFIFVSPTLALVAMERSGELHAMRYDVASGTFSRLSTLGGLFRPVALLAKP